MNKIHAGMHKSRCARAPHPVLFIDGTPLEKWIKGVTFEIDGTDTSDGLVPAQGWLIDEQDLETAWRLLDPRSEHASTVTPILVCPDDMEMSCTVAVVEQVIDEKTVSWIRTGRAVDTIRGVVTSVEWTHPYQTAKFNKEEFLKAFNELKHLTENSWS
jgi:hypothetical protein